MQMRILNITSMETQFQSSYTEKAHDIFEGESTIFKMLDRVLDSVGKSGYGNQDHLRYFCGVENQSIEPDLVYCITCTISSIGLRKNRPLTSERLRVDHKKFYKQTLKLRLLRLNITIIFILLPDLYTLSIYLTNHG